MTVEHILVVIFFVLPGFVALRVYEWLVATEAASTFEITTWSIALSFLSAAPLIAFSPTRPLMEHLWDPTKLSQPAFIGVTIQLVMAGVIGWFLALLATKVFRGRLGRKSFYQRAWDWLWSQYAQERRAVAILSRGRLLYRYT